MDATFEWDGLKPSEATKMLRDLEDALADQLESAANDIGVRIRGDAQEGAPVDTGQLSSDLDHVVESVGATVVKVSIGSNLDHAAPQEEGTSPFFPPPSELRDWARRVLGDADAAYPVARSIAETGLEGNDYLKDALEENITWALDRVVEAVEGAYQEVGLL